MLTEDRMIELLSVLREVQIGEQPDPVELGELIGVLTDEVGYMATIRLRRKVATPETQELRDFLQEQVTETKIRRVCGLLGLSRRGEQAVIEEVHRVGIDDYHRMTIDEIIYDVENFMVYLDGEE